MSLFTVEQALWDINSKDDLRTEYRAQPNAVLARYALSDDERRCIRELDVRALADQGVSQMLLMMVFQALQGPPPVSLPEYLRRMNQGARA